MPSIRIIALAVAAAILYGVLHDQVTARLCVEYFTVGHPRVIASESPTILALVWGVIATWWVGLLLGVPLAVASRAGSRPKLTAAQLVRPVGVLLICLAAASVLGGLIGWQVAHARSIALIEPLASRVPPAKHVAFLAVGAAHTAAYGAGLIGGVVLMALVARRRGRMGPPAPRRMNREAVRRMRAGQGADVGEIT